MERKSPSAIGERIRAARNRKNMSLKLLAERSGLSAMALNLIERNKTSPTLNTLGSIAAACDAKITDFFTDGGNEEQDYVLFKSDEGHNGSMSSTLAANLKGRNLNLLITKFGPHGNGGAKKLCFHPGNEFVYCLSGQIRCELGREEIVLTPGDAVIYKGGIPHRLTNGTSISGDALVILEAGVEHLHTSD